MFRVSWRVAGVGAKAEGHLTASAALDAALEHQSSGRDKVRISAPDGRRYEGKAMLTKFRQDWDIG